MVNLIRGFINGQYFQQTREETKQEETKIDFVNMLPTEMISAIFSNLNVKELARCQRVNKKCREVLWNSITPKIAFGKEQWEKYFGDVGKEPPLPKDIHKILKSPCPFFSGKTIPFFPGKTVEETHMLVLIPETINGKPLNLNTLYELIKTPKEGHAIEKSWHLFSTSEQGNQATPQSHWALMTKDVIKESRNKSYMLQQDLIAEFNKRTGMNYEVPNALDASICVIMHYVSSKQFLFHKSFIHCQEKFFSEEKEYQAALGFLERGLNIFGNDKVLDTIGVAPLRKFF
jgi:hypothetical protein